MRSYSSCSGHQNSGRSSCHSCVGAVRFPRLLALMRHPPASTTTYRVVDGAGCHMRGLAARGRLPYMPSNFRQRYYSYTPGNFWRGFMSTQHFFKESTEQSRIKTRIVSKYFSAWAQVMISATNRMRGDRIAFIDLFAG